MRQILILLVLALTSCQEQRESTPQPQTYTISTTEEKVKRFVFVGIVSKEPSLFYRSENFSPSGYMPEVALVEWKESCHLSGIEETYDITEEYEYKLMDSFESSLRANSSNIQYRLQVNNVRDQAKKDSLLQIGTEIADRNLFVFNSYKDASMARKKYNENPELLKADIGLSNMMPADYNPTP